MCRACTEPRDATERALLAVYRDIYAGWTEAEAAHKRAEEDSRIAYVDRIARRATAEAWGRAAATAHRHLRLYVERADG